MDLGLFKINSFFFQYSGLSMNDMQLHSSIYLDMLSLHMQNFIQRFNHMPTLEQVYSVILLLVIHLQLHVKLSFHL